MSLTLLERELWRPVCEALSIHSRPDIKDVIVAATGEHLAVWGPS